MANKKVRVAIIGVGNCASSLVQGVQFYKDAAGRCHRPGHHALSLGGYHIRDIEFTLGIDINVTKVGKDLSEAIFAEPNNTYKFCDVPQLNVPVVRGMTHDGLGKYLSGMIKKAPGPTADIVKLLKETKTDVVVNFLPVGSEMATKWYVEQVIEAGCAFVNGIPVFIASSEYWAKRFRDAKLPILGDDIKSQVGATILHRALATLFVDRGVRIDRTYQLNFGGNTDFLNMLERERLESKKISKTNAVTSMIPYDLGSRQRPCGPIGPCAVAHRPQVVLHPHGRHHLRRCAAQHGGQARSVGQPQLCRRDDRCHPLRQDRAGPQTERTDRRALLLFLQDPSQAIPRRYLPRESGSLHQRRSNE